MAVLIEDDLKVIAGIIRAIRKANCGLPSITIEGKLDVYDGASLLGYIEICPSDGELVFFNPEAGASHDAT